MPGADTGWPTEAVGALDESELLYRGTGNPDDASVRAADVVIRRAWAYSERGRGLRALIDAGGAIGLYVPTGAFMGGAGLEPDFARVLALASRVRLRFGDPIAARAHARARYADAARAGGGFGAEHAFCAGPAPRVAGRVEAALGARENGIAFELVGARGGSVPPPSPGCTSTCGTPGLAQRSRRGRRRRRTVPVRRLHDEGVPVTLDQALDRACRVERSPGRPSPRRGGICGSRWHR